MVIKKSNQILIQLLGDNDKLQAQLKSYQSLETELVDVHMKNSGAHERISQLEQQIEENNRRHAKELADIKQTNVGLQSELQQKRQDLSGQLVKSETLSSDCARLKTELSRADMHRQRAEILERELAEVKTKAIQQKSEYETILVGQKRAAVVESGEKFEVEIKVLNNQVATLVSSFFYFIFNRINQSIIFIFVLKAKRVEK